MELNGTVAPSKIDFLKSNQSIHGISNSSGVNSPLVSIDHAISATSAKIQVIQSSIIQKEIVILDKLSTPIEAKQDLLVQKEDAIVKIGAIQTLPRQTEDLKSTPNPPQTAIKQDSSLIEKESIIIIDASPLVKVKPVPPIQTEAIITIDASPSSQVEQDLSIKKEAIIILEASPLVQVKPVFPIQTEAIITNDSSPSSQVEQDLSIKKEEIIILEASPLLKEKQDTVAQKESIIKVDNTSPLSQVKQDPIPRKEATINVDAIPSSQVEDKHEPPIIQKQEQVREPPIQTSQFSPQTKTNIQIKGIKLTTTIENNSINVFEPGKKTQFKHFYPLELRRIITATQKETSVTLKACITRKGNRDGSKFKKITFTFDDVSIAKEWCQGVLDLVYETNSLSFKKVIVLYDKYDGKKAFEVLEKFMKPIFDEVNKPIEFKGTIK